MPAAAASVAPCPPREEPTAGCSIRLVMANTVDGKWAEATIARANTIEDMEGDAGTGDNRWRIRRMNGRRIVDEAQYMARLKARRTRTRA